MPDDPWNVLEIAPGASAEAIRRAYVVQLKAIDVDTDPAAFMRLRAAYDAALAGAAADGGGPSTSLRGAGTERSRSTRDDGGAERSVGPAVETVVARRAIDVPYGALSEAKAAFEALIDVGDTREAAALLERVFAQGIVPLGGEDALVRALTTCALADESLSADELSSIAVTFQAVQAGERADALRWRRHIESDAARGGGWGRFALARTRIARALLTGISNHNLWSGDLPKLRIELTLAARYARWFPDLVDVATAEKRLVRLERSLRRREVVALITVSVLFALLRLAGGW